MAETQWHGLVCTVLSPHPSMVKLNGLPPVFPRLVSGLPGLFHCPSATLGQKQPEACKVLSASASSLDSPREERPWGPCSLVPRSVLESVVPTRRGAWPGSGAGHRAPLPPDSSLLSPPPSLLTSVPLWRLLIKAVWGALWLIFENNKLECPRLTFKRCPRVSNQK